MKHQIGVVGLAVMGRGLALNLAEHGFSVAGYNLEPELTAAFVEAARGLPGPTAGFDRYQALCAGLERPRKLLIMVRAGEPVDRVLDGLIPCLEPGDVIIDGGNSHYTDTQRRAARCGGAGVHVLGMGVSGGEEGARHGPALMPGGDRAAYELAAPFLTAIAAHVAGDPCCAYIGPGGAGHYVKMVHNGIEYGDMELICEAYYLLRRLAGLSAPEIGAVFRAWNAGELDSYLMEITARILTCVDPETGRPMVDVIEGAAGSKGTGMWTVQEALSLGVPLPTITQAVFSRYLSGQSDLRAQAAKRFGAPPVPPEDRDALLEDVRRALYASKICSYAQGFELLRAASEAYGWALDLQSIALLFRGGCIIRAAFLSRIAETYRAAPGGALVLDPYFSQVLKDSQDSWRRVAALAARQGVSAPGISASLSYFDSLRDPEGPLNLLQAQRDCFGAHTFRRTDRPGTFHRDWSSTGPRGHGGEK